MASRTWRTSYPFVASGTLAPQNRYFARGLDYVRAALWGAQKRLNGALNHSTPTLALPKAFTFAGAPPEAERTLARSAGCGKEITPDMISAEYGRRPYGPRQDVRERGADDASDPRGARSAHRWRVARHCIDAKQSYTLRYRLRVSQKGAPLVHPRARCARAFGRPNPSLSSETGNMGPHFVLGTCSAINTFSDFGI